MHILQVLNNLKYGGAEKLVLDLSISLADRGQEVEVVLLNGLGCEERISMLEKAGITVHDLKQSNIYNPAIVLKLLRFVKKFEIIHAHLFPSFYWVVIANFLSFSNTKVVVTEHSPDNNRRNNRFVKLVDRFMYRGVDRIISISNGVQQSLERYLKNRQSIVIDNGVDFAAYQQAQALRLGNIVPKAAIVICQVASFRSAKDQDTLIKAVAKLSGEFHLLLVGEGPRKHQCQNLSLELGISNRVHFLGNRTDVPSILKAVDLVVLSSHYEGFGLAAVEGMAAGRVVIASNVEGLADVVRGAGLVFEKQDATVLSNWILRISRNRRLRARLENRCFVRSKNYDIEVMTDKYVEAYTNLTRE